ncbi:IS110 family transposase [Mucilaginibacter lutimaris]|uniref:IS110 family transposase n=1 Tax=Mucilaginibacter lutimaris TaxID=931629 RepID=A0ABW2ZLK3_9SPHI
MTAPLKQTVGIDVAKQELVVSLAKMNQDLSTEIFACKTFINNHQGFERLVGWVTKHTTRQVSVHYVMEATGVYHEPLAYYLSNHGLLVSIVLPNKVSNYSRTLDIKTVTDKTASQAIARFALANELKVWQQPKAAFRTLRQLTRERDQIIAERTLLKNQLHAELTEAFPNERSIGRINTRIALLNNQETEIKSEIADLINKDKELVEQIDMITSIPGVGKLTAIIVIAETSGFELIKSKKQLVSYAGLDVKEKISGISVKGKAKISKKGNRHLRKAMHMPALAALRSDERLKAVFVRLLSRHGIRMKATVAIQRKLLELIYILWRKNERYNKDYLQRVSIGNS